MTRHAHEDGLYCGVVGPPEHVEERSNGAVHVGKSKREKCKEKTTADNQEDRIEAKPDLLLDEMGVEY